MVKSHNLVLEENKQEKQSTIENDVLLLSPGDRIKAIGTIYDLANANHFWNKHGVEEAKAYLVDADGKKYDNQERKGIFQHGYLLKDVSRDYVTFPNEEVIDIAHKLVGNGETGLRIWKEPEFSNNGLNVHIPILSDTHARKIRNSDVANDMVRLGVIIRNSVGGGLALGTDLFSFRDICFNGSIFGHKDIGHMSMRHYGKDSAKITRLMNDLIVTSVSRIEEIYAYYEKMTKFRLREKLYIINDLAHHIPDKYFPNYVDITKEKVATEISSGTATETKTIKSYTVEERGKDLTLWHVFNDFTEALWHSKLNMEAKRYTTMNLHRIVIEAISTS